MELYNYFTEIIPGTDTEKMKLLVKAANRICDTFQENATCEITKFEGLTGEPRFSLIGQLYGGDTNAGDLDLLEILQGIEYTWIDAFTPKINNINTDKST